MHPSTKHVLLENVQFLINAIGDDPRRAGVRETPDRVVRSYEELFEGYTIDPASVIKDFDEDMVDVKGLVYMKDIEFFSMCEHHLLPFTGVAHIGYIPSSGRVIGASKLSRVLDVFARRLQIQERIAEQVTDALQTHLKPLGSMCVIEGQHMCMMCRGVKKHSTMGYSSAKGIFLEDTHEGSTARNEFLSLIK